VRPPRANPAGGAEREGLSVLLSGLTGGQVSATPRWRAILIGSRALMSTLQREGQPAPAIIADSSAVGDRSARVCHGLGRVLREAISDYRLVRRRTSSQVIGPQVQAPVRRNTRSPTSREYVETAGT